MTVWTPKQIATIWVTSGGARNHVTVAVAVALAESGGNDAAHSPSADWGLWQINEIHFPALGWTWRDAVNPYNSARAAIQISGNGTNWAAWCTCWRDPGPNCGHGWLPGPQQGSPAYNQLIRLDPSVGTAIGAAASPSGMPGVGSVEDGWRHVQNFTSTWGRSRYAELHRLGNLARGIR